MAVDRLDASPEQLLRAVEHLPGDELDAFVAQVLALRARRVASHLTPQEANLLLTINRAIPVEIQQRYDELIAKRRAVSLTPEEHAELLKLTDQVELLNVQRVSALADLAQLRRTTLAALMHSLDIQPPAYA